MRLPVQINYSHGSNSTDTATNLLDGFAGTVLLLVDEVAAIWPDGEEVVCWFVAKLKRQHVLARTLAEQIGAV